MGSCESQYVFLSFSCILKKKESESALDCTENINDKKITPGRLTKRAVHYDLQKFIKDRPLLFLSGLNECAVAPKETWTPAQIPARYAHFLEDDLLALVNVTYLIMGTEVSTEDMFIGPPILDPDTDFNWLLKEPHTVLEAADFPLFQT